MKEILTEITAIQKSVAAIDKTTAVQSEQIGNHIRRTELAEKRITRLEDMKSLIFVVGLIAAVVGKLVGAY